MFHLIDAEINPVFIESFLVKGDGFVETGDLLVFVGQFSIVYALFLNKEFFEFLHLHVQFVYLCLFFCEAHVQFGYIFIFSLNSSLQAIDSVV